MSEPLAEAAVVFLGGTRTPNDARTLTPERVGTVVDYLRITHGLVLVDLPTSLGAPATCAALERADAIFVIGTSDLAGLRGLYRLLSEIGDPELNIQGRIQVILNRSGRQSGVTYKDAVAALRARLEPSCPMASRCCCW